MLIAPAGLAVEEPITAKLSKLPLVGDLAMYALGPLVLQSHSRKCFHSPDKPESRRLLEVRRFARRATCSCGVPR